MRPLLRERGIENGLKMDGEEEKESTAKQKRRCWLRIFLYCSDETTSSNIIAVVTMCKCIRTESNTIETFTDAYNFDTMRVRRWWTVPREAEVSLTKFQCESDHSPRKEV